jgi:hypothetical protein
MAKYAQMMTEEWVHMTTFTGTEMKINDVVHRIDPNLVTSSDKKLKVWGYLMTQYNLKPGLRKFGARGEEAAITEMMQLHVMNT